MSENMTTECAQFARSLQNVLETMVFIIADPLGGDEPERPDEELLEARMEFRGNNCGTALLAAPAGLCAELAENMMGVGPDEVNGEVLDDALRETLNMACGQYLTGRWGEDVVFDLTVPTVRRIDISAWDELAVDNRTMALDAEGVPLLAAVRLEE